MTSGTDFYSLSPLKNYLERIVRPPGGGGRAEYIRARKVKTKLAAASTEIILSVWKCFKFRNQASRTLWSMVVRYWYNWFQKNSFLKACSLIRCPFDCRQSGQTIAIGFPSSHIEALIFPVPRTSFASLSRNRKTCPQWECSTCRGAWGSYIGGNQGA